MSLKVWTAYKLLKASDLWPLVRDIRQQAAQEVQAKLREFYLQCAEAVLPDKPLYKAAFERTVNNPYLVKLHGEDKLREYAAESARLDVADKIITRGYRMSTTSPLRSVFNFDVSVTFREHRGSIYIIPYCEGIVRNVLDFLAEDPRLRDYHYQNQTDRPEDISAREWRRRAAVWEPLTDHNRWLDYLVLDICSWNGFWQIKPMLDLQKELHERIFP